MDLFTTNAEPDVESELPDLGTVLLSGLRTLDDDALNRALRQVVEQTGYARVCDQSNSNKWNN